ncbi:MAG TPA: alpha/beta fold hydrolase [Candidatus Sulfotelmatobacter sp.]|jgi:predicted esterase|nr:alpha/beta fold hydrolase [Candidatus Sulfotelmatobacter sp.]
MERHGNLQRRRGAHQFLIGLMCVFMLISFGVAKNTAKPERRTLNFGGKKRTYYVFVPSEIPNPAPLLLLLHGSGHNGMSLIDPWKGLAQKQGIILVAPDSYDPAEWDQRVDGPDFLHAVITEVESRNAVDPRRVYLFGHSGGAMYALALSIVESEYFAATAIHAGALLESNFKVIDHAKRKIPIAIWVGTVDLSFPLAQVRATRDAFQAHGFTVELHEIPGHDHNYYIISSEVNGAAWQFLTTRKLEKDPTFNPQTQQKYSLSTVDSQTLGDLNLAPQPLDLSIWAGAKPYMDDPIRKLTRDIHDLHGLDEAPDQQMLEQILQSTSDKTLDLLRKMPNVISHENVLTEVEPQGPRWRQQFEYLVLRHDVNGNVILEEYRTGNDKSGSAPLSQGSVNAWVLFHPANLAETRFRYLGRQRMDGHATLVLAFAQIPDKVKFPGQVKFHDKLTAIINQGIAWIDASDFRIVRLRTDLLAPRPDIFLKTLTSDIRFSEVKIPVQDAPVSLWLPREARITWDLNGEVVHQLHTYSTFRIYHSKSRIIMPEAASP